MASNVDTVAMFWVPLNTHINFSAFWPVQFAIVYALPVIRRHQLCSAGGR